MHPGVGSRLVYRQLLAVCGLSFALSKRFESVRITCEQAGKRMEQIRAGGGARWLGIGVTECEFRDRETKDGAGAAKVRAEPPVARQAVSGSDKEY